jgi:hypothetical protein
MQQESSDGFVTEHDIYRTRSLECYEIHQGETQLGHLA